MHDLKSESLRSNHLLSNKILLCVSNTGGGHWSAANAVWHAIDELQQDGHLRHFEVVISEVVEDTNGLDRMFVDIYNYLLTHRQSWMKYYYRLIEFVKPNNSMLGYWLASGYLKRFLRKVNPAIVVSLHPMANHYLARALSDVKLLQKPKLIVVLTDPNAKLWTGWACRDAYLTIAPNNLARQRLIELGVAPGRIVTIGMPIDPQFLQPPLVCRETFLSRLGLKPNLLTVCLTAGRAGGGNIAKIYRALKKVRKPIQVIVICGKNEELYREIKQEAQEGAMRTAVLSTLPSMSDLMNASDLLVTKAGGLTTFESVARRLPMAIDLLSEPMPQESGTAEMLIDAGLATPIYQPSDIVAIVEALEHIENRDKLTLPSKYNLDHTDGVYDIARIILANCQTDHDPVNLKAAA